MLIIDAAADAAFRRHAARYAPLPVFRCLLMRAYQMLLMLP